MALRTKTIEYAFPISAASVASATARDFTGITVYIPETPTFRSVILETTCYDNGTVANITAVLMGISLGAVARNDSTVTQTLTASGENVGLVFTRDVTSYFSTNWTGTSMAAGCRLTVTGVPTGVATAKLIITYEYNDTGQTTRIKTVKIPIDGNTDNLTISLANVGGVSNQIPNLDTWLPEASKVYRDIFFETYVHTGTTANTDRNLNMRFDGTTTLPVLYEASATSDIMVKRIDKLLGSLSTNQTNNVEASTDNTGMPFPCLSGILVVTYEYDHSTSTRVMNSLMLPCIDESGWIGGSTIDDASRFVRSVSIQEPGTITLEQSAVLVSFIDAGAVTLDLRIGSQDSRTFAHGATVRCGSVYQMRRFDSGAAGASSGITLQRGLNEIPITYFTTGTTAGTLGSNVSGVMFLNYSSGIHPDGDGAHNHTTVWVNQPYVVVALAQRTTYSPATTPVIPESLYYVTSAGYELKFLAIAGTAVSTAFMAEVQSDEAEQKGWRALYDSLVAGDNEAATSIVWARAQDAFSRYPGDATSSKLQIESTRSYRYDVNPANIRMQVAQLVTYHGITFPITGSVVGGDGSTPINVYAFQIGEHDPIAHVTASSADGITGTFYIPWYEGTEPMIVVASQSADYKGVYLLQTPSGSSPFEIDLSPGGSSEYGYAFA